MTLKLSVLASLGIICLLSNVRANEEDVNVVELAYFEAASSNVEGVTEEIPTTTPSFLPPHPKLKALDKFSVPPAKGREVKLGNLTVYESPYKNTTKYLLISIYDIFGFHPHVKYIADQLADSGFLVVIPDLFHGKPIGLENFPQPDFMDKAIHLFRPNGSWVEIKPDLLKVIRHYKQEYGISRIGIYGFCWGGKIIVYAASDPEFSDLNAIGLVHPSRVTTEDATDIKIPAILLPSNSEPDMIPFLNQLNENKKLKGKSEHYRFDNMTHGFAGARSDFSDSSIRRSVVEVMQRMSMFFLKVL